MVQARARDLSGARNHRVRRSRSYRGHDQGAAGGGCARPELNDRFGRREQPLTFTGRTLVAQIEGVQITTRAARSRDVVIEAAVSEPPAPSTYSFNGMSWDEMTELALRISILGEPNPLGVMAGQAEISNPLPQVAAAGVSAEALRAVCELVLSEVLVTQRGVARVSRVRFGASIAGRGRSAWSGCRPASTASPRRHGYFRAPWRCDQTLGQAAGFSRPTKRGLPSEAWSRAGCAGARHTAPRAEFWVRVGGEQAPHPLCREVWAPMQT